MAIAESLKSLQMKLAFRKDATIAGNRYTLQVLSLRDEQRVSSLPTDGIDGIAFFNELQKAVLSHALRAVDGEEIPDIVEVDDGGKKSTKERAVYVREFLDSLPSIVIENLFSVYGDMRDEKENDINSSLTYSWYKTPKQREEERRKKEEEEEARQKEEAAKKRAKDEKSTHPDVPSPDGDINLKKLPTDYSDGPEQGNG